MIIFVLVMTWGRLSADRLHVDGETMGTRFSVTIDAPRVSDTRSGILAEITAKLSEINAQMSTWDTESEISGFNRSDSTDWFPVSPEFASVVYEAKRIHELSGGAFDPTVSPLIDLWGFGRPEGTGVPDQVEIDEALRAVGMQHVEVRIKPAALRKCNTEVQLNLSAIAKGYAVDAIAEMLSQSGRPSFIVDIGGETRAGIAKASGDPWRIGVESPNSGLSRNDHLTRIVPVTQSSIATSGDYRNFFEADGTRYSHTINPVTGRPVVNPPASVTVIHDSCMTADALATAMMVLGLERGITLAEKEDCSVLFQTAGADGSVIQNGIGTFATATTDSDTVVDSKDVSESWVVFVAAGALFFVAVGGMGVGVLISNRQIRGSCGGLASMSGSDDVSNCELCSIPRDHCVSEQLRQHPQTSGHTDSQPSESSVES
ncbi:MAG: FAD:protein FMN transferase [Fuerstiella sp.]|nr:FAD:protein FMN transferase [Fuerstiella sp.]